MIAIAAVAAAQKVSFDYDRAADFAGLSTFAFKNGTSSGNPLLDRRIVSAIAETLSARGMTRRDANPDLFIVTHLTFEKRKDITAYSTKPGYGPYGWSWGGGWGLTDVRVREIHTGTLIIDVADAKKRAMVWRGMGVKEVKAQPTEERADENVSQAVARILRDFPPNRTS
jgi:hypothetical protein